MAELANPLHLRLRAGLSAARAALAAAAFAAYLAAAVSGRQAALFLVGVAAGLVLYHAAFGFTSSWRALIRDRRGAGLRAQMLMLAVSCAVFFPLLASGSAFGQTLVLSRRVKGDGHSVPKPPVRNEQLERNHPSSSGQSEGVSAGGRTRARRGRGRGGRTPRW